MFTEILKLALCLIGGPMIIFVALFIIDWVAGYE